MNLSFITGKRYRLRPLTEEDINDEYLSWLNDSEVNYYSNRRFFPYTYEELRTYHLEKNNKSIHLAIIDKKSNKHIGNVLLGPIKWTHRCAEISILIGDKSFWGKGAATEAIYLLSKHAFTVLDLNRLESGSISPAFIAVIREKLGWKEEGRLREKFLLDGKYVDVTLMSLLKREFKKREALEA